MTTQSETLRLYRDRAADFAADFDNSGARIEDIERAFALCGKREPMVLELGCGSGRDAREILRWTPHYIGVDYSPELLAFAKSGSLGAEFVCDDMESFPFPSADIIFAFASLVHMDRIAVRAVVSRAMEALRPGGIFYVSLKRGEYGKILKTDEHGERIFFTYTPDDIRSFAASCETVYEDVSNLRHPNWFTLALRKK